jgi:hypothetical protein
MALEKSMATISTLSPALLEELGIAPGDDGWLGRKREGQVEAHTGRVRASPV